MPACRRAYAARRSRRRRSGSASCTSASAPSTAHQAVYTDDAIAHAGGDWGILGISVRSLGAPRDLTAQDGLYTVETLQDERAYRVIGSLRGALAAAQDPRRVVSAIAAPQVHVVSLTVTEKGYGLTAGGGLDLADQSIAADLQRAHHPISTIGLLARGLDARRIAGAGGLTVISCDNLIDNGHTLKEAVLAFAHAAVPALAGWIDSEVRFPNSMVDSITPASDAALRGRVEEALGCADAACVQREPYARWIVEDDFAGPRPAWDAAGVEITGDVMRFQQLKLHVLNTANSCLAYLGLARGHEFAHEAFADPDIAAFVQGLIIEEMVPAFPRLRIHEYWDSVRPRLANPHVRHALRQIGTDGSAKLAQRVFEPLRANLREGRPWQRMAILIRTWLAVAGAGLVADPHAPFLQSLGRSANAVNVVLDSSNVLPAEFRRDPLVRQALAASRPYPFE